jgi:hypothetical protein
MADEPAGSHPYASMLTDLKAQRDKLNTAIAAIEALAGVTPSGSSAPAASAPPGAFNATADGPGAFLGMSITDAAKMLLAARRQPLKNPDIAAAFQAGGLHLRSKDPVNTVGAVLTRRSIEVGDIVKIGRGVWGLKEWYPGRSFKTKTDNGDKGEPEIQEAKPKEHWATRRKREREAAQAEAAPTTTGNPLLDRINAKKAATKVATEP